MSTSDSFKYDVRIRERMLAKGMLTETDLKSHIEALKDLEAESRSVSIPQPAFVGADDEDEFDDEDEDEEDEDEDDDDEVTESTELP
jgi:hypothetical protein